MTRKTNWTATILLTAGSLFILFPLYLTVALALKTPQETASSIMALPRILHFENFSRAIEMTNFFRSFQNSFFITAIAVILTLLTNSMVAYAIARNMDKKYFRFLYYYFISGMFIPFAIIMLPVVKQTTGMGMDNPMGLTVIYIVYGLFFNTFVYVGYLKSIPVSLEEAAIIDGCGVWKLFWKIVFPLMAPINATVGVVTTLWVWNDFLLPLVMLTKPEQATLPLVQYIFQGQFQTDYNLAFASYLMALIPMIIIYVIAQKWIIQGVTSGAIKS